MANIYDDVEVLQGQMTTVEAQLATLYPTVLEENTDLFTLGEGRYIIPNGTVCNTLLNRPDTTGQTAIIDVVKGGNSTGQLIMIYQPCIKGSNKRYINHYYADSWGAWIADDTTDSGWISLTLNEGWSMNDYTTEQPMYRKVGNLVMLRGLVNATTAAGNLIATLPAGFRPATNSFSRFVCSLNQSEQANIQVSNTGVISDYTKGSQTRTFLCLNGISFFVD